MSVSVIITTYHTGPALWPVLNSALKQEKLREVVLVDNGNPPEVTARLNRIAKNESRLRILSGHGNVGFSRGCNIGASIATGEYLLLLNPDSLLPANALSRMVEAFSQHPGAMLAGAQLVDLYGVPQRHNRRVQLTPRNAILQNPMLRKLLHVSDPPLLKETHESSSVSGAFMFLKREDYRTLDGMDEGYFLHVEDMDFSMRVKEAGGKIITVPDVKVLHFGSTSDASSFFIEWHKARGFLRYFTMHFKDPLSIALMCFVIPALFLRGFCKATLQYVRGLLPPYNFSMKRAMRCWLLLTQYADEMKQSHEMEGKQVLVIGAKGQVGVCLIGRLLAMGANVTAVTRKKDIPFLHPNLNWKICDLEEDGALAGVKADIVLHTAPLWLLPKHLKTLSASGAQRLVAFSSTAMISRAGARNANEHQVILQWEEAEHAIQRFCQSSSLSYTLLRPTIIYGTGSGTLSFIASWIKRFNLFPYYPPAKGKRQPVHADDLAQAALHILSKPHTAGRIYNVGGSETLTYRDMVKKIYYAMGRSPRLVSLKFLPTCLEIIGNLPWWRYLSRDSAERMNQDMAFDYSDARRDFGYTPRGFLTAGIMDLY